MSVEEKKARRHMLEALRGLARMRCNRRNCGPCHARKALELYEP